MWYYPKSIRPIWHLPNKKQIEHFSVIPAMVAWVVAKTFDYFYIAAEN
jgi:hypothetical protein